MKSLFTLLFLTCLSMGISAQFALPVDFEHPMEDTVWNQFANAPDTSANFMIVDNPDKTGINMSDHCIMFTVTDSADQWAGAWSDGYGPFEITEKTAIFQMMVYKDVISNCGLKLEAGGPALELKVPNTKTGEWELITFDFSEVIGNTYTRLVFFPDFPDEARTAGSVNYIDMINIVPQYGLPVDFEIPMEDTAWNQFANAPDTSANFMIVENPDKMGINMSNHCIMFSVTDSADQWAGAWSDAYGPITITADSSVLEMMVYKDVISNCGLKVEAGGPALELKVPNTVTGQWELISFDFSEVIGNTYTRLVFFPDFPDEARTAGSTNYIDNIRWGESTISVGEIRKENIRIYPNPASDMLTVEHPDMRGIYITNLTGQRIKAVEFSVTGQKILGVSDLATGLYFVTVETISGSLTTKFLKY